LQPAKLTGRFGVIFSHASRTFCAIGSGQHFALAAMFCEKDAGSAVAIAALFNNNTGGKIHTVTA